MWSARLVFRSSCARTMRQVARRSIATAALTTLRLGNSWISTGLVARNQHTGMRHLSSKAEEQRSEGDFEHLADALLKSIEGALDKASLQLNPEEISCSYGVLTVDLGKRGTWVINKQTPNRQIWWSSPLSGPRRFAYDEQTKRWHWTRDHTVSLGQLLARELTSVAPTVKLNIDA